MAKFTELANEYVDDVIDHEEYGDVGGALNMSCCRQREEDHKKLIEFKRCYDEMFSCKE